MEESQIKAIKLMLSVMALAMLTALGVAYDGSEGYGYPNAGFGQQNEFAPGPDEMGTQYPAGQPDGMGPSDSMRGPATMGSQGYNHNQGADSYDNHGSNGQKDNYHHGSDGNQDNYHHGYYDWLSPGYTYSYYSWYPYTYYSYYPYTYTYPTYYTNPTYYYPTPTYYSTYYYPYSSYGPWYSGASYYSSSWSGSYYYGGFY